MQRLFKRIFSYTKMSLTEIQSLSRTNNINTIRSAAPIHGTTYALNGISTQLRQMTYAGSIAEYFVKINYKSKEE